ncbi:MAG: hypothetical protein ACRD02_14990, partial [Acidimicrobiia bacterium]
PLIRSRLVAVASVPAVILVLTVILVLVVGMTGHRDCRAPAILFGVSQDGTDGQLRGHHRRGLDRRGLDHRGLDRGRLHRDLVLWLGGRLRRGSRRGSCRRDSGIVRGCGA